MNLTMNINEHKDINEKKLNSIMSSSSVAKENQEILKKNVNILDEEINTFFLNKEELQTTKAKLEDIKAQFIASKNKLIALEEKFNEKEKQFKQLQQEKEMLENANKELISFLSKKEEEWILLKEKHLKQLQTIKKIYIPALNEPGGFVCSLDQSIDVLSSQLEKVTRENIALRNELRGSNGIRYERDRFWQQIQILRKELKDKEELLLQVMELKRQLEVQFKNYQSTFQISKDKESALEKENHQLRKLLETTEHNQTLFELQVKVLREEIRKLEQKNSN